MSDNKPNIFRGVTYLGLPLTDENCFPTAKTSPDFFGNLSQTMQDHFDDLANGDWRQNKVLIFGARVRGEDAELSMAAD